MPKRLRYFIQRDGAALNMVLRIFLPLIAQSLSANCPGAEDVDFHVRAVDGVFEEVAGDNWTSRNQAFWSRSRPKSL